MDSTDTHQNQTSTSTAQLDIPPPYKESVIWPQEYTFSLDKNEAVRNAFKKTYLRIQKAGCHFLLLEPTATPHGYFLLLS